MQSIRLIFLIVFSAIFCTGTIPYSHGLDVFAQSNKKPANKKSAKKVTVEKKEPVATSHIKTLPPAYEPQLHRLSEILGSLHYLRTLCGANEGQKWRIEMQEIIATEKPTTKRKEQITARFNRGFRSYREIYRECTPAASQAAAQYLREGVKLSTEIPNRYGG